jgi:DNA-damage-inducible protein D
MGQELTDEPQRHTMDRLEGAKRTTEKGRDYWLAREIGPILGYPVWQNFESAIKRAEDALRASGRDPSHQIMPTHRMMERGGGALTEGRDYFLSRGASYLIAMNGDPAKPEIAAAQIYFAAKTRQMEQAEALSADEKRLELREKVTGSVRRVSSAAKDAGVKSDRQGIFHEQRYRGLYGASSAQVKTSKGLKANENLFDRAGPLELSAHDFQMNLAASALVNENVRGEQAAFDKNLQVAKDVRRTIQQSGGTLPEYLPLAQDDIREVRKRVTGKKTRALPKPKPSTS